MDNDDVILKIKCLERDGEVVRTVRYAELSIANLKNWYDKLKQFPTLFGKHIENVDDFINIFITVNETNIRANGIVWQVDDVGIIWITDIYPRYQASAHFTFWDRKFRGREDLIWQMLQYGFKEFGFHRIVVEVPIYTPQTVALVKRVGFVKEGVLREAAWYRDKWWNVNIYSILESECNGSLKTTDRSDSTKDASYTTSE